MAALIPPPQELKPGSEVWSYLRDSGGDSQELSIGQQQIEIKAYCAEYNLILTKEFIDEARSAGSDKGRDAFADMIERISRSGEHPIGILIWSTSRFAREQNDRPFYRALIRKKGVIFHSLTERLPHDATAIVIEAMYGFANAEKLRQTSRDVKRGQTWLLQQGYATGGVPPRGYKSQQEIISKRRDGRDRIASRWVEDPELWDLGVEVWKRFSKGASFDDLQKLTGGKFYKNKQTWASFFRNRAYLGIGYYGDVENRDHHPAMVDQETWVRVQARLVENAKRMREGNPNHPRRISAPTLLSGFAVCMICGATMCHRPGRWPNYICGCKVRRGGKSCPMPRVAALPADWAVMRGVIEQVFTPEILSPLIEEVKLNMADTRTLERELKELDRQITECKRAINNLLELAETFGAKAAGNKLVERETELARKEYEKQELVSKIQLAQVDVDPQALSLVLTAWQGELAQTYKAKNVPAAQRTLKRFVRKIELGYNRAKLYYVFPLYGADNTIVSP